MKRFFCYVLSAACFLACLVLPVHALTTAQQAYLIDGYLAKLLEYRDRLRYANDAWANFDYFYHDLDGDGNQELFVSYEDSNSMGKSYSVFGIVGSAFTDIGTFDSYYATIYAPAGERRLLLSEEEYGYNPQVTEVTMKNGALQTRKLYAPALKGRVSCYYGTDGIYHLPTTLTNVQKKYVKKMKDCSGGFAYFADVDGCGVPELIHIMPEEYNTGLVGFTCYKYQSGGMSNLGKVTDYRDYYDLRCAEVAGSKGLIVLEEYGSDYKRLTYENGELKLTPLSGGFFGRDYPAIPLENISFPSDADLSLPSVISITEEPKNISAAEGTDVTFSVKAEGKGLKYQWQYSMDNGAKWSKCANDFAGYDTNTLRFQTAYAQNGFRYRCLITNSSGESLYSMVATLQVTAVPPRITVQPDDEYVIENSLAEFSVETTGVNLNYRWQYQAGNDEWKDDTDDENGAASPTLYLKALSKYDGWRFRCVVSNSAGEKLVSDPAVLTVEVVTITKQPAGVQVEAGEKAVFSVETAGSYLSYQWQSKTGAGEWENCGKNTAGADSASLTVSTGPDMNGTTYRCVVTNVAGAQRISTEATLSIKPFGIKSQPKSVNAEADAEISFTVESEGENLTYQWQYKKPGGEWLKSDAEGNGTPTLTLKAAKEMSGYAYRCVIKNTHGAAIASAPALLSIAGVTPQYLPGDVTGDGEITAEDARLALRAAVGLENYLEGSREFLAADATKDGVITAEDARLILRAAVGLETL